MRMITVGSFTPSVLVDVATTTGRLEARGLAVREVPVASSPSQFRSLIDGDLDAALTSPDNVLAYRFSTRNPLGELADVRIVGAVDRGMGLGLYARPGLAPEELRGATAGVDVPTSGFAMAMYALADALGVGRDRYEVVALGSTPRRLEALLAGTCDVTMLNAGNELVGKAAGCRLLASVGDVCAPYLGTVVAVAGDEGLASARALTGALVATAADIVGGGLTEVAAASARRLLGLDEMQALRYVSRMRDPIEGLVADGVVDPAALATLVRLRSTYFPEVIDGREVLTAALIPGSGLVQY